MPNVVKNVVKSGLLQGGENVDAASIVMPVGMPNPAAVAFGLIFYFISQAKAKKLEKTVEGAKPTQGLAAGFPIGKKMMTVAATNQRLIVMSNGAFAPKPKAILASIPWTDVVGATIESVTRSKKRVTVTFRDNSKVAVHVVTTYKPELLADAINKFGTRRA
jgi:hypothetical protein